MVYKKAEEIEAAELELKEQGASYHRWKDTVAVKGTGKFDPKAGNGMPKGKTFIVHKLIAQILVKKGYAAMN